jgi:hypothetical protein
MKKTVKRACKYLFYGTPEQAAETGTPAGDRRNPRPSLQAGEKSKGLRSV